MNAAVRRAAWREYADLLEECGLAEANARGFTVRNGKVESSIELREGLTEEFYECVFARLPFEDRIELATGVVRHLISTYAQSSSVLLEDQILNGFSQEFIDSLPVLVESQGFGGVAALVKEKVAEFRRATPKKPPPERACLFRRYKYGDIYFWHVRLAWKEKVEETEHVGDNVGMHYIRWFLQSRIPVSIASLNLVAKVNPPSRPRQEKLIEKRDEPESHFQLFKSGTQAGVEGMTAAQLDNVIDGYQVQIDRLAQKQKAMIEWSDKDDYELQGIEELIRELKKERREDFTRNGRRHQSCTRDALLATDRIDHNLRRSYAALLEKKMDGLVAFLREHIKRRDFGFCYFPPDPPIEWHF